MSWPLPLKSKSGQVVPLGDVADIRIEAGPVQVNRERLSVAALSSSTFVDVICYRPCAMPRPRLAQPMRLHPGYHIEWGGQFEHFLEAKARLMLVVPLALGLILFLLWLAFGAFTRRCSSY